MIVYKTPTNERHMTIHNGTNTTSHDHEMNPSSLKARNMNCSTLTAQNNSNYNKKKQKFQSKTHKKLWKFYLKWSVMLYSPDTHCNANNRDENQRNKHQNPQMSARFQLVTHQQLKHEENQMQSQWYQHWFVVYVCFTFQSTRFQHEISEILRFKVFFHLKCGYLHQT